MGIEEVPALLARAERERGAVSVAALPCERRARRSLGVVNNDRSRPWGWSVNVAAALSVSAPPVKRIPPFVAKVAPVAIVKSPDDRLMINNEPRNEKYVLPSNESSSTRCRRT